MLKKFLFFSVLIFLPFLVSAQITDPAPYCIGDFHDDPFPVDVHLTNVTLGTINNTTGDGDYSFYNTTSTDLSVGTQYTVSLTVSGMTTHGIGVWIDYNQDEVFDDSERVMNMVDPTNLEGTQTQDFTIPATALLGNTRMRVRAIEDDEYFMANGETNMLPCNSIYEYTLEDLTTTMKFAWGETEDYNINITNAVPACVDDEANVTLFVYSNKNYEIVQETKTWEEAAACAVARGGQLVEINDQAEQDEIFLQLGNAAIVNANTIAPDGGGGAYVWIGGNDLETEGNWIWDGDNDNAGDQFWQGDVTGAPVGGLYNNWGDEPDNAGEQDALGLSLDGWPLGVAGEWNDVQATNNLYYVIEYPENEPVGEVIITSENNLFFINVNEQTLQMFAETTPTDEDVVWSVEPGTGSAIIDDNGLLTPLENGIVTVVATAIIDGIETTGTQIIIITNQASLITATPTGTSTLALCTGETGELAVFVDFKEGVTGNASINLTGIPTGVVATFAPLNLTEDGLVNITITNTSGPFVVSDLVFTASLDGTPTVAETNLSLETYNGVPFFMNPVSPANNAINISQTPTLDWTESLRAQKYEVEIATDIDFINIIINDDEVAESQYSPVFNFAFGSDYFWKVRPINPCGIGVWTPVRKFTIQPEAGILGCTDSDALNYNPIASVEDGSCTYPIEGCTDVDALNYNDEAVIDDGSCVMNIAALIVTKLNDSLYHFEVNSDIGMDWVSWNFYDGEPLTYGNPITYSYSENGVFPMRALAHSSFTGVTYVLHDTITIEAWGCTDPFAFNFDLPSAYDDGSCIAKVYGCTNPLSTNYNSLANVDDGSCSVVVLGCTDADALNYNPDATNDDGSCIEVVLGCTDETALNYDADANMDDGSCIPSILGCMDEDAFNYNPDATVEDGSCIDVILGCTDVDALNYNINANTDDGTCLYDIPNEDEWQVTTTSENHSILIQSTIDLTGVTPALTIGDYIGVFFTKDNGSLQCAGRVAWTGSNLALTAYGNEDGEDNGFEDDENFVWKLWRSSNNSSVEVSADYDATQSHQGQYANDGISALTSLSLGITQSIALEEGWNFISSHLSPVNSLMDSVFSSVNDDLFLAKDENGNVYWPGVGVNNIGNHIIGEAYKVNMNADAIIDIKGVTISPEDYDISLSQGWSYIGYLRDANANITSVMNTVSDKIFLMKNIEGDVYWPQFNINNIGNMEIGAGYQINMISDTTFSFPSNSIVLPELKMAEQEVAIYFNDVKQSTRHMHLAIPVNAWKEEPTIGSEIAVFAGDILIGSTVWNGENNVLTIFGNEQNIWDNHLLTFKGYIDNKLVNLDVNTTEGKAITFVENDVLMASKMTRKSNPTLIYHVVDKNLVIEYTEEINEAPKSVLIQIVDYLGRSVYTSQFETMSMDKLELPKLESGQYIINIKENGEAIESIKWMNF